MSGHGFTNDIEYGYNYSGFGVIRHIAYVNRFSMYVKWHFVPIDHQYSSSIESHVLNKSDWYAMNYTSQVLVSSQILRGKKGYIEYAYIILCRNTHMKKCTYIIIINLFASNNFHLTKYISLICITVFNQRRHEPVHPICCI